MPHSTRSGPLLSNLFKTLSIVPKKVRSVRQSSTSRAERELTNMFGKMTIGKKTTRKRTGRKNRFTHRKRKNNKTVKK